MKTSKNRMVIFRAFTCGLWRGFKAGFGLPHTKHAKWCVTEQIVKPSLR